MDAYIKSETQPTPKDVADYINDNMRWLGKYPSKTDRSALHDSIIDQQEFIDLQFGLFILFQAL